MGDGSAQIEGTDKASISYTYATTGLFTAQLSIFAPSGQDWKTSTVQVKVENPALAPELTAGYTQATKVMALTNMPATTNKVSVTWDDGTSYNAAVTAGTTALNITKTYKLLTTRLVAGSDPKQYKFKTVVRLYNGTALVGTFSFVDNPVTITLPY
jgi:PKD repeat protein